MADADIPRSYQLRAKTDQVVQHHFDDAKPGKPLYLLIPGGLIAIASLVLIIYLAYAAFLDESMSQEQGIGLMLLLAPFYIGGVFLFSYGYELYDLRKALRLTAIIVFITVAAVVIVAVLFAVLGSLGKGSSSKSSSKSSSRSGGGGKAVAAVSPSSSGSGSSGGGGVAGGYFNPGPILFGGGTNTVTREIVHEVPVEPPKPVAVKCENCGRPYIPSETKFACPNCGAPATSAMIELSARGNA
jgi:hypothetical protein